MQSELQPRTQLRLWRCRQLGQLIPARCNGRNHPVLLLRIRWVRSWAGIMIPAHDCKTTFVHGVNPWGEYTPQPPRTQYAMPERQSKSNVLAVLADGEKKSSLEIATSLKLSQSTVDSVLRRLWKEGSVERGTAPVKNYKSGHREHLVYWVQCHRNDNTTQK